MYPPFPAYTRPRVLDYTQAAEIDGQFFYSGISWDMVARNYTAQTLNLANNSTLTQFDVTGGNLYWLRLLILSTASPGPSSRPMTPRSCSM